MYDLDTLQIINLLNGLAEKLNNGFRKFDSKNDDNYDYILYNPDVYITKGTEHWYPAIVETKSDGTPFYYDEIKKLIKAGLKNVYVIENPLLSWPRLLVVLRNKQNPTSDIEIHFSLKHNTNFENSYSKWIWQIL